MNRDRSANGISSLCPDPQLTGIAAAWAASMATTHTFAHQDLYPLLSQTSFTSMGENILVGPGTMSTDQQEAVFMGSPDHRANILNPVFSAVGVGVASSTDGLIWVAVDFGG
jgi:uncharacterized protein YkwD